MAIEQLIYMSYVEVVHQSGIFVKNIFDNEEIVPDGMVKFLGNIKVNEAYIGLRNL